MRDDKGAIVLVCVIVNCGAASTVLQNARRFRLPGGTVLLGRGTVRHPLLETLALNEAKKEVVLLAAPQEEGLRFAQALSAELKFHKRSHGVAFVTEIAAVWGSHAIACGEKNLGKEERITMYQSVFVIVDKGKAELAVDAATRAGATGATIIGARGSGIHETGTLFHMHVEPEKEIVLMVLKRETAQAVAAAVKDALAIEEPGNGILFVHDVSSVFGLYE